MGEGLCIERAGVEHAPAIAELNQHVHTMHVEAEPEQFRALTPDEAASEFTTMLRERTPAAYVATRDARSVGYIWAEEVQRPENPFTAPWRVLYIHHIAVAPESRRSGVGGALVAAVEDEARRRGVTSLGLDHWSFNVGASRFFQALGFEPYNVRMRRHL